MASRQLDGAGKRLVETIGQEGLITFCSRFVRVPSPLNISFQSQASLDDIGVEEKPKKVRQLLPEHLVAGFQQRMSHWHRSLIGCACPDWTGRWRTLA